MDSITGGKVTVADVVRMEVLGPFIHQCILWLDRAEREEREGLISDDRFAKGVQNVIISYVTILVTNYRSSSAASTVLFSNSMLLMLPRMPTRPRLRISPYATRGSKKLTHYTASLPQPGSNLSRTYVPMLLYD
jgi:hypothetical protein